MFGYDYCSLVDLFEKYNSQSYILMKNLMRKLPNLVSILVEINLTLHVPNVICFVSLYYTKIDHVSITPA